MKTKRNLMSLFTILGMVAVFTLSSCEKEDSMSTTTMDIPSDIIKLASSNPELTILEEALNKANLVRPLQGDGPFTVFAPTNEAFYQLLNDLGASSLDDIDVDVLTNVLLYHVVSGEVTSSDLRNGYIPTLAIGPNSANISLMVDADNLFLNNSSQAITTDVMASNGVVHVINKVLLPPTVVDIALANSNFSILIEAVVKAGLVETLQGDGPFTIFAPTNAAFKNLFAKLGVSGIEDLSKDQLVPILLYHVVSGNVRSTDLSSKGVASLNGELMVSVSESVTINGTTNVILTDVQGVNGVIHVIDSVLLP